MKDLVSDGFAQVVKPYIDAQDKTTREILAPVETDETDASRAYQIGDQLILGGILYDVIDPISQHGIITSTGAGANIEEADNITDQIDAVNQTLTNVQNTLTTLKVIKVSTASFSSLPQTVNNSKITENHEVINSVLSNPSAIISDIAWTTANGSITLSGTISGSTSITLYLATSES